MTNEQIVAAIKEGQNNLLLPLWENLVNLIRMKAGIRCNQLSRPDEVEDLVQECWFLLPEAIKFYDPEKGGSFANIFCRYFVPRAFAVALYGTRSLKKDPLFSCESLDVPLHDDEDHSITLADMLPDAAAEEMFLCIDQADYRRSLRGFIDEALRHIPENEARLITAVFRDRITVSEAHRRKLIGPLSNQRYQQIYHAGLNDLNRYIRRNRSSAEKVGILFDDPVVPSVMYFNSAFRYTGTSPVEAVAIRHEERQIRSLCGIEDLVKTAASVC